MGLDFRILGPLRVAEDGAPRAIPAGKQRRMLAALLIRANGPVPGETLIEALWTDRAPGNARNTLHTHMKRLRQTLGPVAGARVRTGGDGYLLSADESELDHLRFAALRDRTARAAARGDWAESSRDLRAALALWEGRPLEDLAVEGWMADETARLEELRWLTAESWVEAEQRLGRYESVVPDLRSLTRAHPLRERLHAQLMLSLHATGRTAEAIEVYRQARAALVDGLGIEPGSALRAAHQAVLAGSAEPADVEVGGPDPDSESAEHGGVRPAPRFAPRALPAAIGDFTGRTEQVERLLALLPEPTAAPRGETVVISSIGGMGGVGKTTLAVHVGHLVQDRFPAGQLYANLRGTTAEPLDSHDVLGGFLRQLGVPSESVPAEPEERAAQYRSVLADRGVLVLLDDASDAEQLRPLIPGGSGSMVLVTARQSVTGLAGAVHLHLDSLDPDSARELFARIVGAERVAAESAASDEVLEICAGLPLAVRLAGVRLATRPNWRVRDLADRLHSAARRLDGFDVGDQRLRATFEVSYRALLAGAGPEQGADDGREPPAAARAFCLLGLWTGPALGLPAACALLGLPPEHTEPLLERLVDANLVESPHPGRYGLHDLLRAYAAERARTDLTPSQLESAVTRLLTWYTLAAAAADRVLAPSRSPQAIEDVPGLPPEPAPATAAEAAAWCQGEQVNLVSAVHLARARGPWRLARQLPTALWSFFRLQGDRRTWVSTLESALEAVQLEKDPAAEAAVRNNLAIALIESGRATEAVPHLETSAAIRRDLGDFGRAANTLMNLGIAAVEAGEPRRGIDYLREALEMFRGSGDRSGLAMVHTNLGQLRMRLGEAGEAIAECREAERLYLETAGADPRLAEVKETLSEAHLHLGDVAAARREIEGAVRIHTEYCDRHGVASALRQFGHVLLADGETEQARKAWQEAAEILVELADPAHAEIAALLADLP